MWLGDTPDTEYPLTTPLITGTKIRWYVNLTNSTVTTVTKERLVLICDDKNAVSVTVKYDPGTNTTTLSSFINGANARTADLPNLPDHLTLYLELVDEMMFDVVVDGEVMINDVTCYMLENFKTS